MNELPIATFLEAIQATYGTTAHHVGSEHVVETFQGQEVWRGDVLIFELEGHAAPRCYAWSVDRHVTTVLHEPPVDSPIAAVRAAIAAGSREEIDGPDKSE